MVQPATRMFLVHSEMKLKRNLNLNVWYIVTNNLMKNYWCPVIFQDIRAVIWLFVMKFSLNHQHSVNQWWVGGDWLYQLVWMHKDILRQVQDTRHSCDFTKAYIVQSWKLIYYLFKLPSSRIHAYCCNNPDESWLSDEWGLVPGICAQGKSTNPFLICG
jgi:hypothetical protein